MPVRAAVARPAASVRKPRREGAASADAAHTATAPARRRPAAGAGAVKARHAPTHPAVKMIARRMVERLRRELYARLA